MVSWKLKATALTGLLAATASATKKQPNIITILTDDQDWEMNSLDYMPLLKKYVLQEGTLFDRHYCTVSICCPSRVNIWTGYAAHNSNVTDVFPPYVCHSDLPICYSFLADDASVGRIPQVRGRRSE